MSDRTTPPPITTTDPTNYPPLWRMMHDAYLKPKLSGPEGHLGFAAEIRAIAEWIETRNGRRMASIAVGAREVAAQLRAEADRAEAEAGE